MSIKTAIVTSYRGAAPILDSFLRYHLSLGFDHIFLFCDDPEDPGTEIARRYPAVIVVPHDEELRGRWRETPLYRERAEWFETYLDREVQARQVLNVEVAAGMALERGIDWLLHIDADELFHCPGTTVAEHFRRLSEQGCSAIRYVNHEAAPEDPDVVDPFLEVTLFKKHPRLLPGQVYSEEQRRVIGSIPGCPRHFFHFYRNGKSAARVAPGLHPRGVHGFSTAVERQRLYRFQRWLAGKAPFRWLREKGLAPGLRRFLLREGVVRAGGAADPAVLHYPCCTFEVFWEKYRILGRFDDRWFGRTEIRVGGESTHLDSRDVVMQGDMELAEAFYRERFVLRKEDAERLLENGLALRIRGPAELLAAPEPGPHRQISNLEPAPAIPA